MKYETISFITILTEAMKCTQPHPECLILQFLENIRNIIIVIFTDFTEFRIQELVKQRKILKKCNL